ncbi:MAG: hypothetical protein N3B21_04300 [Clostridia bacterium]|nr:hypothetical protein [Clostridia bacterium]
MSRIGILVKGLITAALWILYFTLEKVYYPVITNEEALKQLEDTSRSFTDYAVYQNLWNAAWVVVAIISVLIFLPEFKAAFRRLRGGY